MVSREVCGLLNWWIVGRSTIGVHFSWSMLCWLSFALIASLSRRGGGARARHHVRTFPATKRVRQRASARSA